MNAEQVFFRYSDKKSRGLMTWVDEGQWGPTGDASADFPPGTDAGTYYNPSSERPARLSGADAEAVSRASTSADAWLNTSQYRVGIGEYLISLLQKERTSRELTDAEKTTIGIASEGCTELQRDWESLGKDLKAAVDVCQAEREGTWYRSSTQTEDCRKLWARYHLARSRGRSQIGAGVPLEQLTAPGAPQPGCTVIQMIVRSLERGSM